jgi:hypothetical protein
MKFLKGQNVILVVKLRVKFQTVCELSLFNVELEVLKRPQY